MQFEAPVAEHALWLPQLGEAAIEVGVEEPRVQIELGHLTLLELLLHVHLEGDRRPEGLTVCEIEGLGIQVGQRVRGPVKRVHLEVQVCLPRGACTSDHTDLLPTLNDLLVLDPERGAIRVFREGAAGSSQTE